jgi:hypothetical protein
MGDAEEMGVDLPDEQERQDSRRRQQVAADEQP